MKRRILSMILALGLIAALLTGTCLAANGGANAAEARSGVVRVLALMPDGNYSVGSAFGVGKAGQPTDIFVTNRHVIYHTVELDSGAVTDLPAVSIWLIKSSNAWTATGLESSQLIPCDLLYTTDGYPDIAIIRAAETPSDRVALPLLDKKSEDGVKEGDSVFALGYPGTSDLVEPGVYTDRLVASVDDVTITNGIVSRFTTATIWGNTKVIQHNAQLNHGNSGGPLLNEKGQVMGINTYLAGQDVSSGDTSSYYSVRIGYVRDALDELEIEYDTGAGLPMWIWIAIGAAVVVAAIVVILVVVLSKNKKKAAPQPQAAPAGQAVPAGQQAPLYRVQGQTGAFAGRRFALDNRIRIGCSRADNDLVYPEGTPGVSNVHCVLTVQAGQVYLKDLGSTYGTFLANGHRLNPNQPVLLRVGDTFCLGSAKETFVLVQKGGV